MTTPTTPRPTPGTVWGDLCATAEQLAAYREGQLAEQRHQYLDPAEPPHAFHTPEVTA